MPEAALSHVTEPPAAHTRLQKFIQQPKQYIDGTVHYAMISSLKIFWTTPCKSNGRRIRWFAKSQDLALGSSKLKEKSYRL
jgi:hypothetical protein